jgi:hypothetical protein
VLDITVDRLVPWNEITPSRIEQALARRMAIPLSPAELSRCFPELWPSEDAARSEIRRLLAEKGVELPIDFLIGKWPPLTLAAYRKHEFAFSGLVACGYCGCSLVGEIKKQRYI